jgi:hypothetical protein
VTAPPTRLREIYNHLSSLKSYLSSRKTNYLRIIEGMPTRLLVSWKFQEKFPLAATTATEERDIKIKVITMMNRLLIIAAAVILQSPIASAAKQGPSYGEFPYTPVTYSENRSHELKSAPLSDGYLATSQDDTVDDKFGVESPGYIRSVKSGVDVDLNVDQLYGTYGVFQARSDSNASTYLAVGFTLDEFTGDNPDITDDRKGMGLSYGFGVTQKSFKLEYMMYMDENNLDISTIGFGLVSEF